MGRHADGPRGCPQTAIAGISADLSYPGLWPREGMAPAIAEYTGNRREESRPAAQVPFNVILQGAGQLTDRHLQGRWR